MAQIGSPGAYSQLGGTRASFRHLLEREIQAYISMYSVLSYGGAFESDAVLRFAERISGSYNFVTALPVSRLIVFLRAQGMEI
jgi:predicted house-cleaning NTP pyrophosphatase (Maf/HAM1 superfamily)